MRISDWSSDVCSSDLHARGLAAVAQDAAAVGLPVAGQRTALHRRLRSLHRGAVGPAGVAIHAVEPDWAIGEGGVQVGRRGEGLVGPVVLEMEEHTSELQSLMRISYAVFCLKKKKHHECQETK